MKTRSVEYRTGKQRHACVPQLVMDDCAAASVAAWLLACFKLSTRSVDRLLRVRGGATLEQVAKALCDAGCKAFWVQCQGYTQLCEFSGPVIVLLRSFSGCGHFVVIFEASAGQVTYADPSAADVVTVAAEEFQASWTGLVLFAAPPAESAVSTQPPLGGSYFWGDILDWARPFLGFGVLFAVASVACAIAKLALLRELLLALVHHDLPMLTGMLLAFGTVTGVHWFFDRRAARTSTKIRQVLAFTLREVWNRVGTRFGFGGAESSRPVPTGPDVPVCQAITSVSQAAGAIGTCILESVKLLLLLVVLCAVDWRLGAVCSAVLVLSFLVNFIHQRKYHRLNVENKQEGIRAGAARCARGNHVVSDEIGRGRSTTEADADLCEQFRRSLALEAAKEKIASCMATAPLLYLVVMASGPYLSGTSDFSVGKVLFAVFLTSHLCQPFHRILVAVGAFLGLRPHINRVRRLLELSEEPSLEPD